MFRDIMCKQKQKKSTHNVHFSLSLLSFNFSVSLTKWYFKSTDTKHQNSTQQWSEATGSISSPEKVAVQLKKKMHEMG